MSSGRSWSYQVVSAEELRRRALAAANARLERANQSVAELQVMVAAATASHGAFGVRVPKAGSLRRGEPEDITRVAAEVEAEVAGARAQVEAAVAGARAREIERVTADLLEGMRPVSPLPDLVVPAAKPAVAADRPAPAAAVPASAQQLDDARRVIARLPGDAGDDVMDRCRRLVVEIGEAATPEAGEVLIAALRQEVQRAQARRELMAQNRAEVEDLYRQLDGLDAFGDASDPGGTGGPAGTGGTGGPEIDAVRSLRGYLRGIAMDAPLPTDLAARVGQVRDAAVKAQDRRFALAVARKVFTAQGYTLGEDFVALAASPEGALVPSAASRRHGARVRERAGRVLFEVVRFDKTDEGLDDVAAATSFCHSVDAMVRRAGDAGLEIADRVFVPPHEGRVEVLDMANPFPAATTTTATTTNTTTTTRPAAPHRQQRERPAPR